MRASWCWLAVEMTLSENANPTGSWHASALLNGKTQTPSFLRTQWDDAKVHSFGPWRVADRSDPTDALTLPEPLPSRVLALSALFAVPATVPSVAGRSRTMRATRATSLLRAPRSISTMSSLKVLVRREGRISISRGSGVR